MTEKLPVWKIYRSHFISWRYEGCSDDIEDLDFSDKIIESLKKYGKYEFTLTVDNIILELGYMPCNLIENLAEVFPDSHEDDEGCPLAENFEVEWL